MASFEMEDDNFNMPSFEMGDEELSAGRGDYHLPSTPRFPTSPRAAPFEQPGFVPNAQNPSVSTSIPNVGGRPPHPHAMPSESQTTSFKRAIRNLEVTVHDLRANNRLLRGLLSSRLNETPTPDVAKWEFVKPHMKTISQKLMLGVDVAKSGMFPHEEHIKQEILDVFNVGEGDIFKLSAFERVWEQGMKTKVKTTIINRRGRFASDARLELWRLLGVPKPMNGSQSEMEPWKTSLLPLHRHNNWRWKDDDPFGSDAFYGAIARIMSGKNYSMRTPISMLPDQLAWFAYVLGLAMDGDRNMKDCELRYHKEGIEGYRAFILERRDSIKRINVIHEAENIGDVLETDMGSTSSLEE